MINVCYIRIPRYVKAYLVANASQIGRVSDGVFSPQADSTTFLYIKSYLYSNVHLRINPYGCFCARQWRSIVPRWGKLYTHLNMPTEELVAQLSGLSTARTKGTWTYIAIRLPAEVIRSGISTKTTAQWQLTPKGAQVVQAELIKDFRHAMYSYISEVKKRYSSTKKVPSIIEIVQQYLVQFDDYYATDPRKAKSVYDAYCRYIYNITLSEDDYVEFSSL